MTNLEVLNKIIPNAVAEMPLVKKQHLDAVTNAFYEKEAGKWYIKSRDSEGREKLIYNAQTNKGAPEEIVRQCFLRELTDDYGYPIARIRTEVEIKFGENRKGFADIVVYQEGNESYWLLVETKAPDKRHNVEQLKSYLNTEGSPIGVGFNAKNITRFIRPYPRDFDVIPDLPTEAEYQIVKKATNIIQAITDIINSRDWVLPKLIQINTEKQFDLRAIVVELNELVLANSGESSFDEIFKIIYAKLYDEFKAISRKNQELLFRNYATADIIYTKINDLFDEAKRHWKGVFEPTAKIRLTPQHLAICINKLTEVRLFSANLRIIDEAFEFLVTDVAKSNKGQYFTPRVVIDACVQMLNPHEKDFILDPACGSAGFLVHAMEYVWDKYNITSDAARSAYAERHLWGIDFDEKASKISRAIMLIAGDGKTHIFQQNTLDFNKWSHDLRQKLVEEELITSANETRQARFDLILSNPPFAGDIKEKAIINTYEDLLGLRYTLSMEAAKVRKMLTMFEKEYNLKFDFEAEKILKEKIKEINADGDIDFEEQDDIKQACNEIAQTVLTLIVAGDIEYQQIITQVELIFIPRKSKSKNDTVDRHILFIQRIIDMLAGGGRAVIVLPQGVFNNSSERYIRRYITERARLLGVVGLHVNSFKPHTGTKTSLLFIRKYSDGENQHDINIAHSHHYQHSTPLYKTNQDYPIFFATSTVSFKNNSGNYLYALDAAGNRLTDHKGNPYFHTDLYAIAQAFRNFGIDQLAAGDTAFDFLKDLEKKP